MSEVGFDGGKIITVRRPAGGSYRQRVALLTGVAVLCGAAYLAGMWSGMRGDITCAVTSPGTIVCGTGDADTPMPAQPTTPEDQTSSA